MVGRLAERSVECGSVFSDKREILQPEIIVPKFFEINSRMKMDGLEFLDRLPDNKFPICFFDPQYRGVLDHLGYGNEGDERGKERCSFKQMDDGVIQKFIKKIDRILMRSGHLFLWVDKFHLCQNSVHNWVGGTTLDIVDLIVWDKDRMGMGYRSRRISEYLIILQKKPRKVKGVWKLHNIPDVWKEKLGKKDHIHRKPCDLQEKLISAVSHEGDVIIDPAAGSFSVMEAAKKINRKFLGCDLNG